MFRDAQQRFLLIGRNAWLSQQNRREEQISLNSAMKILGTKLIEVCCGLFETLEGSTPSALESDNYNLTSELITMLSDDLFNGCCCPKVYSYEKIYKKPTNAVMLGILNIILVGFHAILRNFLLDLVTFKLNVTLAACPALFFCSIKTLFQKRCYALPRNGQHP